MKFHGVQIQEGSSISNLTVASGTAFPVLPNEAEVFFRTDSDTRVRGMYAYIGGRWGRVASADAVTVPSAADFPALANTGDLFYKDSNDTNEALYVYNGATWSPAASGSGATATVTGDVTGTLIVGGTGALTLANVITGAAVGTAANSTIITYDSKGRITNSTTTPIAIAATQVTTGSFTDARIAQSNVTQYQGALSIAASQTTSGTFADTRIASTNVIQHQANLTILETQITNGTLLARVADNETITGAYQFNNPIVTATPISGSHATTKDYVDQAIAGLSWKNSALVATTANITLSGTQTIDGVAVVAGNRVLVKNQSTQAQNGVYVVAAGAWTRAADFDAVSPIDEVNSAAVFVQGGASQADTAWTQTAPVVSIGLDSMVFAQFAGSNTFAAGAGLTITGNTFNVGTASTSRLVINTDDIDLALVTNSGIGTFQKLTTDSYGRVSGTSAVVAADVTALVNATYVAKAGDTMTGNLVITNDGQALRARQVTTAGNVGLRIEGADIIRRFEMLFLGTTGGGAYGAPQGSCVINTAVGIPLYFATADLTRLIIGAAGNVTINTAASGSTLTVNGSSTFTSDLIVNSGSIQARGGIPLYFWNSDTTNFMYIQNFAATGAGNGIMAFVAQTGGERMRIDANGALLLGTGANPNNRHLMIGGRSVEEIVIKSTSASGSTGYSTLYFGNSTTDSAGFVSYDHSLNALSFGTNGTERGRITGGGNVGINTTTPSHLLTIKTKYSFSDPANGAIRIVDYADPNQSSFISCIGGTRISDNLWYYGSGLDVPLATSTSSVNMSAGAIIFNTNSGLTIGTPVTQTERMRLDVNGNLGLGTSAPTSNGATFKNIELRGTSGGGGFLYAGDTSAKMRFGYSNASGGCFLGTLVAEPIIVQVNLAEVSRFTSTGITVTGTVTETSTIRVKKNVRPIEGALQTILGLEGVVYDMKDDSAHDQVGLIAEQVDKVLPNVVYRDDDGEIAGVQYARVVAVLIEAMKEQEARIKTLEAQLAKLID